MSQPKDRTLPTVGVSPCDFYSEGVIPVAYFQQDATMDSTERHTVEIVSTATFASSESHVGLNIVENAAGTAGAWACGIFANVVQDSTKRITGYLCAGEFQLTNAAANASAMAVLVLDWSNTSTSPGAPGGSTQAYIQLRDYSSGTKCSRLLEFTDATIGADADVNSLLSANNPTAATHCIRFSIANVPYWIMCVNTTGLTS